ncbi:MAG: ribosome assembly cofactor RimP [Dysgonamonadaceae bacterium]|jgi:ribosome maturation factor RimP|nr:ribosome assembly cofactor RimP [Dysgonamonadaceae bacterium]
MITRQTITPLLEAYLNDSGMYLVDLEIQPGNKITVEIDRDDAVSIDDCVAVSKYIESQLDRDIEDYELEVGSPGISQPFKILRQYLKNIGKEVEVLTKSGRKVSGVLKHADQEGITLTVMKQIKPEGAKRKKMIEEDTMYRFDEIKYTKYSIRFK